MILRLILNAIRKLACPPPPPPPAPPTEAEIDAALAREAKVRKMEHLDWRNSIVDLMTLLDIDPSFDHRKHLWDELGFEGDVFTGTAEQNHRMHADLRHRFARGELD